MVIIDTGPLVAVFDESEPLHDKCKAALRTIKEPLLTTWPVLTEAFYLMSDWPKGQRELWEFILAHGLVVDDLQPQHYPRMKELMEKYADRKADVADVSLVVIAEFHGIKKIFTLDKRDFSVYRPKHCRHFEILP